MTKQACQSVTCDVQLNQRLSPSPTASPSDLSDDQLLRYSRHILLPEFDIAGQEALSSSTALIVGLGGLGSPAALFLAASGVGRLILCDADTVDLTNLQRQIAHDSSTIGMLKVESARTRIAAINPEIDVEVIVERLGPQHLASLVSRASVVLDCTDNFVTRHAINRACVRAKVPLVSGAAVRFEGQLSVFDSRDPSAPCYHCVFGDDDSLEEMRCAIMGVLAPLVGVVGSMQAVEAIKVLASCGAAAKGKLITYDALSSDLKVLKVAKDPDCPVCSATVSVP